MNNKDNQYFKILEIEQGVTLEEIKKAYRNLVKKWHPDQFSNNVELQEIAKQKFIAINEAYEVLLSQYNSSEKKEPQNINHKLSQNKQEYYYNLGVIASENEDWEEAFNYFTQVIKIDPNFANAYFYRGTVLEKQGFFLRAESDFSKYNQLKGKNFRTNTNSVSSYQHNNQIKKKKNLKFNFINKKVIFLLLIFMILLLPISVTVYQNIKFLQALNLYFNENIGSEESINATIKVFNDYGGENKAIQTGRLFCSFLREEFPISNNFNVTEQELQDYKGEYLAFLMETTSLVGQYFSDGDSPSFSNIFRGNINPDAPSEISSVASAITYSSVQVYCPEYKSLYFLE